MKIGMTKFNGMMILCVFVVVFPIIPDYFYINISGYGIRFSYLFPIIMAVLMCFVSSTKLIINKNVQGIITILFIWAMLRVLVAILHGNIMEAMPIIIFLLFAIFFMYHINSPIRIQKIIDLMLNVSMVIGLLGIVEEVTGNNLFSLFNTVEVTLNYNILRFGLLRIISFTSHAITYGIYCMFVLSLAFYRMMNTRFKENKKYVFIYVLFWINLILTLSRSVIICTVLCQILLLWRCGYKIFVTKMFKIIVILIIVGFIAYLFIPQFKTAIRNVYYTVLVVFDEAYASALTEAYNGDNVTGIGNRFQLYSWVWQSVKDKCLIGVGGETKFTYSYFFNGYNRVKESIEVEYLSSLYHYGFIGLIPECLFYLSIFTKRVRKAVKVNRCCSWETKISYAEVFLCTLFAYLLVMFAVGQSTEFGIFVISTCLFISYMANYNFFERN